MPTLDKNDAAYAEQLNYWEPRSTLMLCYNNVAEVGFEIKIPSTTMSSDAGIASLHRSVMSIMHFATPPNSRVRLSVEVAPLDGTPGQRYAEELKSDNPAAQLVTDQTVRLLDTGRRNEILNEYRIYLTCTMPLGRNRFGRKRAFGTDEIRKVDDRAWELRIRLQAALQQAGFKPIPFTPQDHFRIPYRYFNPQYRDSVIPTYTPPEYHLPKRVLKKNPELASPSVRSQLLTSNYVPYEDYAFTSGHFVKIVTMGHQPVGETHTGAIAQVLNTSRKFWLVIDYDHRSGPLKRDRPLS